MNRQAKKNSKAKANQMSRCWFPRYKHSLQGLLQALNGAIPVCGSGKRPYSLPFQPVQAACSKPFPKPPKYISRPQVFISVPTLGTIQRNMEIKVQRVWVVFLDVDRWPEAERMVYYYFISNMVHCDSISDVVHL